MFLFCDHFIWLHRAKVINVDVDGWNELSNRWWLYGDIMNLARDIYEVRKEGSFVLENKPLLVDLVKNLADIILPLAALGDHHSPLLPALIFASGYLKAPRIAAFLGVVSSLLGTVPMLNPRLRL